jgi:hypothetical protein
MWGQAFWKNEILCQNFRMLRQAFWCCCLIVLVLSLPPTGGSDMDLSGFWGKVQISMTFAGLTVFGLIAYPGSPRRLVMGLIAMGLLIELVQSFAPWQYSEPDDLLAVMTGIMIVRVIWVVAFRR